MAAGAGRGGGLRREAAGLVREAWQTAWMLFRILIPLGLAARLLVALGAVEWIGRALAPVMALVGLPGSMGIVWATAMLTSIYGGMAVFVALAPAEPMTVAQITVLGALLLTAHGLPVELRIAQRAGARLRAMLPLRVGGALLLGAALNAVYRAGGWLQQPGAPLWTPPARADTWLAWGVGQVRGLVAIFGIVLALLVLMRILHATGWTAVVARRLAPVLRRLGLGAQAAPLTTIGLVVGLTYGGGLIIREAEAGRLAPREVVVSLGLMSLCHSLIEDTLLVMLLGARASGVLWGRLAFALAAAALAARLLARLPDRVLFRHFFRATPATARLSGSPAPKAGARLASERTAHARLRHEGEGP